MAYVAPSTVTTLQTYTSAAHNIIVNDIIDHETRLNSYSGVYTNEAARDAAITSPVEGMSVYLTAPTVPAATGSTTAIPTGIRTIYNGSAWVCITPIHAYQSAAGTFTGAYTATLSGSPGVNPSVTLSTGTTAKIAISTLLYTTGSAVDCYMGVAVSGATTLAAADGYAAYVNTLNGMTATRVMFFTGLTAGTNTFTLQYRTSGNGNTAWRALTVEGIA